MIDLAAYESLRRRLASSKPHLQSAFQAWVEALSAFKPVEGRDMEALFRLCLGTEYAYAEPGPLLALLLQRGELGAFSALLHAVAARDHRCASIFVAAYPRMNIDLKATGADILSISGAAALASARAHETLEFCFSAREGAACRFFLGQFAVVAARAPAVLPELLSLVAERAGKLDSKQIWDWLTRGTDLMTSGRVDEGVKVLLLQSGAGRRLMGLNQAVLEEFSPSLKIYAASLAGCELSIAPLGSSSYGLSQAYTDGACIFLPPDIHFFKDEDLNRRIYSTLVALMAGGMRMGSWGLDFSKLRFRDELAERYGTALPQIKENLRRQFAGIAESVHERTDGELEAVFAPRKRVLLLRTDYERLFFSLPAPVFARELFCLIETLRVAARLGSLYPGFRKDYALLCAYRMRLSRPEQNAMEGEQGQFLRWLEAFLNLALSGKSQGLVDERLSTFLSEAASALSVVKRPQAEVEDSAEALFRVYNLFSERFRVNVICQRLDIRPFFSAFNVPGFWPEIVASVSPGLMKLEEEREYQPEDASGPKLYDFSSTRTHEKEGQNLARSVAEGKTRVYRYREWDFQRGSYVAERCTLFESSLPAGESGWYEASIRRYARLHKQVKKRFLSMKAEEVELSRGWYDGNEINVTDMVDYCQSLARGESPDEKIYYQKILNRRDLAVAVLLDASNSTSTELGSGSVIDIERAGLALLAGALDAIEDSFALYAFNSAGPKRVYFNVVKDFEEAWGPLPRSRIASIQPFESNRDGCALRHAAARLAERPEKTKLLLLLSDGIPADIDYGTQRGGKAAAYAIEDTRMALLEARALGVTPFCLTIDSQAKDYVARLYGQGGYALLSDVSRLPERLSSLYLRITG